MIIVQYLNTGMNGELGGYSKTSSDVPKFRELQFRELQVPNFQVPGTLSSEIPKKKFKKCFFPISTKNILDIAFPRIIVLQSCAHE